MKSMIGGRRRKALPLPLELLGVLEWRRDAFERKFGRPPMPGEPLFFDPEAEEPRRLRSDARRAAQAQLLALTGMSEKVVADFVARY